MQLTFLWEMDGTVRRDEPSMKMFPEGHTRSTEEASRMCQRAAKKHANHRNLPVGWELVDNYHGGIVGAGSVLPETGNK